MSWKTSGDKISGEIEKESHDEFQPGAECRKILEILNNVADPERAAGMDRDETNTERAL